MYMVIEREIVEVNVNLLFVLHYIIAMHVADTKCGCKMSISFHKLFKYISEMDLFTTPKEMIDHYYSQIKQNGILNDSVDVVRGQTCKKAFDYQFMTVEGKKLSFPQFYKKCFYYQLHTLQIDFTFQVQF